MKNLAVFLAVFLAAQNAVADPPKKTPPASAKLDFDLLAPPPTIDPGEVARIEGAVKTRRRLLLAHQYLGFALLAVMTANTIVGQLNFDDTFAGSYTQRFAPWHEGTAVASLALFGINGLLALAAPTPYPKPYAFDRVMAHRILMGAAAAGMILQTVLGIWAVGQAGHIDERDFALVHLVSGYATYGLLVSGALVYVF